MPITATPVTVLGLGPMGTALAAAFLAAGHPTTVWNRTAAKADALVAQGAIRAERIADAVAASELIVVCVRDTETVQELIRPVAEQLRGRTLLNYTSGNPRDIRALADWAAAGQIDYLDGVIMTQTVTIGGPEAVFLYSGTESLYQAHQKTLVALGGTATYLGADPGRAAGYDVALLDLFGTGVVGIEHAFALARAEGIAPTDLARFATGITGMFGGIVTGHAQRIEQGSHPGDLSTIDSAKAGLAHIIDAAREHGLDTSVLTASQQVIDRAIAAGHGQDGLSRLAEFFC